MISDIDTYKGEYCDNTHLALPWTVLHCGQRLTKALIVCVNYY